jgi:uncharacterized damage-inducible protein DinB
MNQKHLIAASLGSTRTELAEVFPHVSDDILDWAPAPGMRTIKGQFVEIIGTEISIIEQLMGYPKRPYAVIDAELANLAGKSDLIGKLIEVRGQTLKFLDSKSDDQLDEPTTVSGGFLKYLELETVSVAEMLRFLVRHEAYHTGQLVSYLWARGNNPYTWEA